MAYVNVASLSKVNRAAQLLSDLGSAAFLMLYDGTPPASPDTATTALLLGRLPLPNPAAVVSRALVMGAAGVTALVAGSGGTDGSYALAITGTGGAAGTFTVSGGAVTAVTITAAGSGFSTPPTLGFGACPGLTGASAVPVLTAVLVFNAIAQESGADNTGDAGWARLAASSTAGASGIIDLDCGVRGSGASVILNTTAIVADGPIVCTSIVLTEA